MKVAILVIGLTVLAVTSAEPQRSRDWPPKSTGPTIPRNPSGGHRFRRSPDPADNSFSGSWSKPLSGPERRPSYNLDYKYNFVDKNRGSVSASVGAQKLPGQRFEPTVGVQGELRFRREADSANTSDVEAPENEAENIDLQY